MDKTGNKDAFKLMLKLNKERITFYNLVRKHGRTHPWVLEQSRKIDRIINELQRLRIAL